MLNTNFTLDRKLSAQDIKLHELVENLLVVLSEKEKFIIKSRFALNVPQKLTLEQIGQQFGVTRERVRQIEKTALRKLERNAQNTNIRILTEFAKALLQKEGGIAADSYFKEQLLKILPNITSEEIQELHLALSLDRDIHFEPNTLKNHPYWRTARFNDNSIATVGNISNKTLSKTSHILPIEQLAEKINENSENPLSINQITNIFRIIREYKITDQGIGLYNWRHINPRTLKDKIIYILNREKRPLHFEKLTNLIRESKFDQKRTNIQAVHNELIRNENFILIGRGIYALQEWGYKTGTVADVITEILADGVPRSREEITKAVLDQRHVKTITIYLNLKNKNQFARVGRDKYTLLRFA
ncbi:hypothetical protein IPG41_01075 [Candidatus Peregrinibacteria bacterium]|nr:MAG: hypothetical protein IPG41_01075 [Candidatus Peregrinibacteria bacterium]